FEAEVMGLLGIGSGAAVADVEHARAHVRATEVALADLDPARSGRATPLELLAREFELNPVTAFMLVAIAAPRLRGRFARLYKILANDHKRPFVDEQLLVQILGDSFQRQVARELDADRPLRRFGLIEVTGERPHAAIAVDPLVVRIIANRPLE